MSRRSGVVAICWKVCWIGTVIRRRPYQPVEIMRSQAKSMRIGQQKQHVHFKTCLFRQAASALTRPMLRRTQFCDTGRLQIILLARDSLVTNWTATDSITQLLFGMGLIWTLLGPFPGSD